MKEPDKALDNTLMFVFLVIGAVVIGVMYGV